MRLNRQFVALLLPVLLVACSSDKSGVEPAKLADFESVANVEIRWQQDVGDAGFSVLTPAVTREAVFAASAKRIFRFDRNSGKQVWRIEPGFVISGGVGAGEGLVLVGSDKVIWPPTKKMMASCAGR